MPSFSTTSKQRLETCDQRLQNIFNEVIKYYDITIVCGERTEEEQNAAYAEGLSKLKYPQSKHNSHPSRAVDVVPYPIDWDNLKRFYYLAGIVESTAKRLGYKIRWGGDWDRDYDFDDQRFMDLPHFEILD